MFTTSKRPKLDVATLKIACTTAKISSPTQALTGNKRTWDKAFGGYSSEEEGIELPSWTLLENHTAAHKARIAAFIAEIAWGRAARIEHCCIELAAAALELRNAEIYIELAQEQCKKALAYFSRGGVYDAHHEEWR